MRAAFIKTLMEEAFRDNRIWLLTGDLGYSVLEPFINKFPERFVNVGVAEQNMVGVAGGLALSGKIVFIYSIANFPIMRCLEQIRNDLCYHNLNVNIIAVGGGVGYGTAGYTHHAIEDLAIMRAMPNMTVIAPGDPVETCLATSEIAKHNGPCYLRIGKTGEAVIHETEPDFKIGKAIKIKDGNDFVLISTGSILNESFHASIILESMGYSVGVISMHTLNPIDTQVVRESLKCRMIVTIEEHSHVGGLGEAVSSVITGTRDSTATLLTININNKFLHSVGNQEFLYQSYGLTRHGIVNRILDNM